MIVDASNSRFGTYSAISGSGYQIPTSTGNLLQGNDGAVHESRHIDMPEFNTMPRPMGGLVRDNHILYPEDAPSYIMPDNEVVRWFANNTILTDDALVWRHDNSTVEFNYMTDDYLFNNPVDGDYWQNPDYYLTHDSRGDCEDFSLAFASILEAKGIAAEVIGARLINGQFHWIVQYEFNGHERIADINRNNVIIFNESDPKIDEKWVLISKDSIIHLNS